MFLSLSLSKNNKNYKNMFHGQSQKGVGSKVGMAGVGGGGEGREWRQLYLNNKKSGKQFEKNYNNTNIIMALTFSDPLISDPMEFGIKSKIFTLIVMLPCPLFQHNHMHPFQCSVPTTLSFNFLKALSILSYPQRLFPRMSHSTYCNLSCSTYYNL